MVIFGRSVFYLFGRLVNKSAIRFSIFSAVWIRPYVEVHVWPSGFLTIRPYGQKFCLPVFLYFGLPDLA